MYVHGMSRVTQLLQVLLLLSAASHRIWGVIGIREELPLAGVWRKLHSARTFLDRQKSQGRCRRSLAFFGLGGLLDE